MKSQGQTTEAIRAHVVLKGASGTVTSGEPISSENIQTYMADPQVRERARAMLEKQGFLIRRVSPLSITIEASPARFETVFQGRLTQAEGFWTWSKSPVIPAELSDIVDAVVFPQPTKPLS